MRFPSRPAAALLAAKAALSSPFSTPAPHRMKRYLAIFFLVTLTLSASSFAAEPLRVFIRGGAANRGEEVHAHPRFLAEWKTLLAERGMKVDGAIDWPTAEQVAEADVIVAYAQEGGDATPEQQQADRGVHEARRRAGGDPHGGGVDEGSGLVEGDASAARGCRRQTKWKEGPMDLYYTENQQLDGGHPITKGASNFHLDDEIYYDMDISPEVRVLATSYTPKVQRGQESRRRRQGAHLRHPAADVGL